MNIPIIIFGTWWINLIIYGGIFLVVIIILILGILDPKKNLVHNSSISNFILKTDINQEQFNSFKSAMSLDALKDLLIEGYYNLEEKINIRAYFLITPDEIIKFFGNKKIFIFNNQCQCKTTQTYITDIEVKISYTQGYKIFRSILDNRLMKNLSIEDKMVYDKIHEIFVKNIKTEMADYEKELVIHDYLIRTSRYDAENFKNNSVPEVSYTPYGLLINHKAVCSAYAEVFTIFMTLANIECYFVIGSARDSSGPNISLKDRNGHAWNIVKIQNKYYHIDVTFDNPVPDVIGKVNYNYFNLQDKIMGKTHLWEKNDYPICDSNEYSYYNLVKSR